MVLRGESSWDGEQKPPDITPFPFMFTEMGVSLLYKIRARRLQTGRVYDNFSP
jgi:hypothetical protein